jgi:hypothetical protein
MPRGFLVSLGMHSVSLPRYPWKKADHSHHRRESPLTSARWEMDRKIVVAGEVPYEQYFRLPLLFEGRNHQCATFYLQWHGMSSHANLTSFDGPAPQTKSIPLSRLPGELGEVELLIFYYSLRPFVRALCLKRLLRPRLCFWDYSDDFYYGKKTLPKLVLTSMWQRMCDRVLVLSPTLLPRFRHSLHWDNASSLTPQQRSANRTPIVGTIASLDERFDRVLYEGIVGALPDFDFQLYGRIHNYRNRNHVGVRQFEDWLAVVSMRRNFKYFGAYSGQQLQAIVSSFDIGLIPYLPGRLCEHINPDKYYHYTNAGLPVVSSLIPSLAARPNIVFYSGLEDLVGKVRSIAAGAGKPPASVQFNWADRLVDLLRAMESTSSR